MKAKITLSLLLSAAMLSSATAQQLPRLNASSEYGFDGTNYIPTDSVNYGYGGSRGSSPQKWMNIEFYDNSYDFADSLRYASGTWSKYARTTKAYDGSDNLNTRTYQTYSNSNWDNKRRVTMTYKANKPDTAFQESWSTFGSGGWRDYDKFGYTWSGNNVATITRIYYRFGQGAGWRNDFHHMLTYSGSNIATITRQSWNNSGSSWVNDTKDEHTYGANGLTETKSYIWNTGGNSWTLNDRVRVTYTGGKRSEMITDYTSNNGSTWDNSARFTYTYIGSNTLPDTITEYTWSPFSSLWANTKKSAYKYNSYGQVTEISTQSWDGAKWIAGTSDDRKRYYYDLHPTAVTPTNPLDGAISLYPSPASTNLNVQVGAKIGDVLHYTIIGTNGAVIKSWSSVNTGAAQSIATDNMPAGNYYMTINDSKNITTKQFSVVK